MHDNQRCFPDGRKILMSHDILIVDDELDIRSLLSGILQDEGYDTRQAANSTQAIAAINLRLPTLIILDIWLLT